MLLRRLFFLALILLCDRAAAQISPSIPAEVRKAMEQLAKEPFRAHMAFLAADLLEGRGTGTRGQELAARYVAAQFEVLGLTPAGTAGTFYQRVPLREDRKSTRLNSSHGYISYAVFCLKKKKD